MVVPLLTDIDIKNCKMNICDALHRMAQPLDGASLIQATLAKGAVKEAKEVVICHEACGFTASSPRLPLEGMGQVTVIIRVLYKLHGELSWQNL